jgi:hypothetical protein
MGQKIGLLAAKYLVLFTFSQTQRCFAGVETGVALSSVLLCSVASSSYAAVGELKNVGGATGLLSLA